MGGRPISTLGYERATNPYLDPSLSRTAFVELILANAPPFPPYYRRMKKINSDGPTVLAGLPGQTPLTLGEFESLRDSGATIVDLRDPLAFSRGHVPGSICIGIEGFVSVWASWVIDSERPVLFVGGAELGSQSAVLEQATRCLIRVGIDSIRGTLEGGFETWRAAGLPCATMGLLSPKELAERREEFDVIDVRMMDEYEEGHIPGATHCFLGQLVDEFEAHERPQALVCKTGYRSAVAVSTLLNRGFSNILSLTGGMEAWHESVQ